MDTTAPKTGPHGCPSEDFDQLLDDLFPAGSTFQMDFSATGFEAAGLRSVSSALEMDMSTNPVLTENATDPPFLDGCCQFLSQPSLSDLLMDTSTNMFCDAQQPVAQKRSHELTTRPAISQPLLQASSQLSHSSTMPRHERPREARQFRATQSARDMRAFGSALYPDGSTMGDNDMLHRSQLFSSVPPAAGLTPSPPYSLSPHGTLAAQSASVVAGTSSVTNMTPFASAVSLGLSIPQSVVHPLQQNQHDTLLQDLDKMAEMVTEALQKQKQGKSTLHTLSLPAMRQDGCSAPPPHHQLSLPVSTQELYAALPTGSGPSPHASSTQTTFKHARAAGHQQTALMEQQQAVISATASVKLQTATMPVISAEEQLQHQQVLWAATAALQQQTATAMAAPSHHSLSPTHSLSPHRSLSPNHSFTTHHSISTHQSSAPLSSHNSLSAHHDTMGLAPQLSQQQIIMAPLTPKSPGSEAPSHISQRSDQELGQHPKVARIDSSASLQPSAALSQHSTTPASPPRQPNSPPRPDALLVSHHSSPSVCSQPGSPQSSGQKGAASGTVQHTCTSCGFVSNVQLPSSQQAESIECSTPTIAEQPRSPASMLMEPSSVASPQHSMPLTQPHHTFPHQSQTIPQFQGDDAVAMQMPISSCAQQMPGGGLMLMLQLPISYAQLAQLSSASVPMHMQAPVTVAPLSSSGMHAPTQMPVSFCQLPNGALQLQVAIMQPAMQQPAWPCPGLYSMPTAATHQAAPGLLKQQLAGVAQIAPPWQPPMCTGAAIPPWQAPLSAGLGMAPWQAPLSCGMLMPGYDGKLMDFAGRQTGSSGTTPVGSPPLQHMLAAGLQQKVDGLQQGLESLELHHRKLHAELKKEDMHLLNGMMGPTQDVKNLKQQIYEVEQRNGVLRAEMQQLVQAYNSLG